MEKILTKEEIEALLAAVFEGRIVPEKELAKGGALADSLICSTLRLTGSIPNLDIVYDSFIRYNRVTLSNRLGKIVEIKKQEARPFNSTIS